MDDVALKGLLMAAVFGLVGKIVWDWLKEGRQKKNGNIDPKVMAAAIGNAVAAQVNTQLLQPVHDHISRSGGEIKSEVKDCEKGLTREVEIVQDHLTRTEPVYREASENAKAARDAITALTTSIDRFIDGQQKIIVILSENKVLLEKISKNGHG